MTIYNGGSFFKKFKQLASGSIAAQLITLAISPILTRMFTPSEFGWLAFVVAGGTIISSFLSLKLDYAIPKKDNLESANSLLNSSFFLVFLCLILLSIFVIITGSFFPVGDVDYYYFALLIALLLALNNVLVNYMNYLQSYKLIAIALVINSLLTSFFKLGFGFIGVGNALLYATVLGSGLSLLFIFLAGGLNKACSYINLKENLKKDIQENFDFIKFYLPSSIFSALSMQMPALLIGFLYGSYILGFYSLSIRILQMPVALIGASMGRVYYKEVANLSSLDEQKKLTIKLLYVLIAIGFLPIAALSFFGETIFLFIFGSDWGEAGVVSELLGPWIFLVFIFSPLINILLVKNEQRKLFYTSLLLFIFRTAAVGLCYVLGYSFLDMFQLFALTSVVLWLVNGYFILNSLKFKKLKFLFVSSIYLMMSCYVIF